MKTKDIVLIEWIDAQTLSPTLGIVNIEELKNESPILTKSVGFLVSVNKDCYVIANELWEEANDVKYIHIIPKCCVKKVKVLKNP